VNLERNTHGALAYAGHLANHVFNASTEHRRFEAAMPEHSIPEVADDRLFAAWAEERKGNMTSAMSCVSPARPSKARLRHARRRLQEPRPGRVALRQCRRNSKVALWHQKAFGREG